MDKISLNIQVPKGRRDEQERYYVSGEINELGNCVVISGGWQERRPMKKIIKR